MKRIKVARIKGSKNGESVTYGVSNSPYIDLSSSGDLEKGYYLPVMIGIPDWSEQARHPYQAQTSALDIGDIVLDNTEGEFNDFEATEIELQQGPPSYTWNENENRWDETDENKLEAIFIAKVESQSWSENELTIRLKNYLDFLERPVADNVFDSDTPNETLINTLSPVILGRCFQIKGKLVHPQIRYFFIADNIGEIAVVQEGGNNTENWAQVSQGFQMLQESFLVLTCDASGPPLSEQTQEDVIEDIGSFEDFTDGDPNGFNVVRDDPYSDIEEHADGIKVVSTANIAGDSGLLSGDESEALSSGEITLSGASTIHEAVSDPNNSAYVEFAYGGGTDVGTLFIRDLGIEIPLGQRLAGIEVELDVNNVGTQVLNQTRCRLVCVVPDGTWRRLKRPDEAAPSGIFYLNIPETRQVFTWGEESSLGESLAQITEEQAINPNFGIRVQFRRMSSGFARVRVHSLRLKAYFEPAFNRPSLTTITDRLIPGDRYKMEIEYLGGVGDSIRCLFNGTGEAWELSQLRHSLQLEEDGISEQDFVADGEKFAIAFDRGEGGNGEQVIRRISLTNLSLGIERYTGLMTYCFENLAEVDSERHLDIDMINKHELDTGSMVLGIYIDRTLTFDQLFFKLAGSLGGPVWSSLSAKVKSFVLLPPPKEVVNNGQYLEYEGNQIDDQVDIWHDDPVNVTDVVKAAKNQHPIPQEGLAGITSTFTEADQERAMADFRITRKVNFEDMGGFIPIEPPSGLSIASIDPTSGDEAGGTAVTITGTGFESGATVAFGGVPATDVVVVDSETITCVTPAYPALLDVMIADGPVTIWDFDQAATTVPELITGNSPLTVGSNVDLSGSALDKYAENSIVLTDNNAQKDDVCWTDTASTDDLPNPGDSATFVLLVRRNGADGWFNVHWGDNTVTNNQGTKLRVQKDGALWVEYFNGSWRNHTTPTGLVPQDTDALIHFRFEDSTDTWHFFVDGVEVDTVTIAGGLGRLSNHPDITVGGIRTTGGVQEESVADCQLVAFYRRAMTNAEIANHAEKRSTV